MAQGDYLIQNQGFPAFRSDLNSTLEAINTSNSGTSRPTSAVAGTIWLDTTNATNPTLKFFDGTDDISLATIDYSANTVNWLDSSVVADLVNDSTPQLGGMLDVNGNAIGDGVLELLKFIETASAVNELTITNSATGNAPELSSTGDDTNIDIKITPKGSGNVVLDGLKYPNSDGTADQVLKTDGSGNLSFTDVSGGISWQSTIVTGTTLSAVAGNGYWIDTTSNACTITLPASASVGDQIIFSDYKRTWGTNAVTINQNSLNFQGYTSPNPVYDTNGQSVTIVYSGATQGWIPTVDDNVTYETAQSYNIEYLVVAGGGAGGNGNGGGGGAGGILTNYGGVALTINGGTTYTLTVGAGGAGGISGPADGPDGLDSTITGTGLTTITAFGGGGGGTAPNQGGSGGSGGGNGYSNTGSGGSGTVGQGNNGGSGSGTAPPAFGAGGGGGAGAVGGNGTSSVAGNGGNGTANSITGSSVTYAGGGGGSTNGIPGADGSGGSGGGGAGSSTGPNPTPGTANTGGGGGGGNSPLNAGGGSGVIILRMATADYSGTTTGSPTVTTSGSDTILTYTGTGTYTG